MTGKIFGFCQSFFVHIYDYSVHLHQIIRIMEYDIIIVLLVLLLGWMLDLVFGDPVSLPHPIVWMGKWIAFGEHTLNNGKSRMFKGALFTVCSIVLVYLIVSRGLFYFRAIPWVFLPQLEDYSSMDRFVRDIPYIIISAILVFYCLAGHTLRKEVRMVFEAVDRSVEAGRKQVARIVGRDTSELSAQECRTAALETLAENLSDGVIAPLFWFLLLGIPGMLAYKMINTFDSMIGYQNERYKDFGCWAAKIDDAANYVPARITALFIIVAYKVMCLFRMTKNRESFVELLRFIATFGPKHASPNSGWPESALAGILNCRFGGPHNYFGEYFYKPYIGVNERKLTTSDMQLSVRISLVAEILMIVVIILLSVLASCLSPLL